MPGRYYDVANPLYLNTPEGIVSVKASDTCIIIHYGCFEERIFVVERSQYLPYEQYPDLRGAMSGKVWDQDKLGALLDHLGAVR